VLCRAAIVLSGLGYAVAFFGALLLLHRLRRHERGKAERDDTGDGGLNFGLVVHGDELL